MQASPFDLLTSKIKLSKMAGAKNVSCKKIVQFELRNQMLGNLAKIDLKIVIIGKEWYLNR